jgi:drug/metabolite transporter (DMT)-like permease
LNSTATPGLVSTSARQLAHSHARMHLLMLLATFCWAANIVAGKEALKGLDPLALAQLRVIGAAVLFGLVFIGWQKEPMPRLTRRGWLDLLAVAACGVTFNQLFFIGGLAKSSATHTGMVVAVIPVMVLVLSCALRMEPLTMLKFVGMLTSFVGVAILTTAKAGRGQGDLILLAGSAVFALFTIIVKRLGNSYRPLAMNTVAFGLGSVLMLPFGLRSVLHVNWKLVTFSVWWGLGFMAVFGSVVAYLAFAVALTELTASRVAAFGYLQPMLATGLSIWLLGERITTAFFISGILILSGVYLAERERGEERTTESG